MGTGKKMVNQLIHNGNLKRMGWTPQQQQTLLDQQKNSYKNERP
jgi:hypothetical protein